MEFSDLPPVNTDDFLSEEIKTVDSISKEESKDDTFIKIATPYSRFTFVKEPLSK